MANIKFAWAGDRGMYYLIIRLFRRGGTDADDLAPNSKGGRMKPTIVKCAALGLLLATNLAAVFARNDPPDPKQFPETVKIISETKQSVDKGSTVTTKRVQPTILNSTPRTQSVVKPNVQSYYQCTVQIGGMLYTINGKAGGPGVPLGTFKARITNQYMDIYIVDKNGPYVLGFEIAGAEKIESAKPEAATSPEQVANADIVNPPTDAPAKTKEAEQWYLESYNERTGYVFRKDGIHYTAHCRISYLHEAANVLPAASESECSTVLPYLHKPLSLEQGPRGPDLQILRFTETHEGGTTGWHCEFTIAEAK